MKINIGNYIMDYQIDYNVAMMSHLHSFGYNGYWVNYMTDRQHTPREIRDMFGEMIIVSMIKAGAFKETLRNRFIDFVKGELYK